jgi:hypothetical protein
MYGPVGKLLAGGTGGFTIGGKNSVGMGDDMGVAGDGTDGTILTVGDAMGDDMGVGGAGADGTIMTVGDAILLGATGPLLFVGAMGNVPMGANRVEGAATLGARGTTTVGVLGAVGAPTEAHVPHCQSRLNMGDRTQDSTQPESLVI